MEYVKLRNGTSFRVIEYTVFTLEDGIAARHFHALAEAMARMSQGARMTRLVERDGRVVEHAWNEKERVWYDENGRPMTDEKLADTPAALPMMHILEVHPSHLDANTKEKIRNLGCTLRTTEVNVPYGAEGAFVIGTAIPSRRIVKEMPDCLIKVLRFAAKSGCGAVVVTDSADPIAALPVFKDAGEVRQPPEFNSERMKAAYAESGLTSADFPAKIEITFEAKDENRAVTELFDIQDQDELPAVWDTYCGKHGVHRNAIKAIEKLCSL